MIFYDCNINNNDNAKKKTVGHYRHFCSNIIIITVFESNRRGTLF